MIVALLLVILCETAWSHEETPLGLPRVEGSKSFDLEIDQANRQGIQFYRQGNFEKAIEYFGKAFNLAEQLRDPNQGVVCYNLALSLYESGQHEEAAERFFSARRFARGNPTILESKLLKIYECGFNPGVACKKKIPLEMNSQGSR